MLWMDEWSLVIPGPRYQGDADTPVDVMLPMAVDLAKAFDRLSPADRQVLVLRELEGFSNAEAATILGVELAAIKSRLHRARLRLVAAMKGGGDDVR